MDLTRLSGGGGVLAHGTTSDDPADRDTVAFAAAELAVYLGRIFGSEPAGGPPRPAPAAAWLRLEPGDASPRSGAAALPPDAEAVVQADDDGVTIAATSPRALVGAAYAFLESLGCRWSPDGPAHEHVPRAADVPSRIPGLIVRPAFARRAWASDLATWHYTVPDRLAARLPDDLAFIDWLAKSGATGLLFIRHANDTQWVVPALLPALRRRGLALEVGGHAIVELLPRALFATHPEYFPLGRDGRRTDLGNVCASSPAALAIVSAAAQAAVPGASTFHLWGLDLRGGGWCHCAGCAASTPSDQALAVCNHVAGEVPGRLFHLAYHDTLPAPRRVRPRANVWAEFAPRERCYGHALDDPSCPANGAYRQALLDHLELFDGRVDVFEYYADAILFGGCAVPLAEVIGRDLAYYRAIGVGGVSCLTFGRYSLWAYGANVAAFAAGTIDPAATGPGVVRYCERRWGRRAGPMRGYLAALERLMAPVVTYGDVLLPPGSGDEALRVRDALAAALDTAPAAVRRLLPETVGAVPADERLLDYTLAALAAVRRYLDDRLAGHPVEQAAERATAALGRARAHVQAVDPALTGTWGRHDLELTHHFYAAALRV